MSNLTLTKRAREEKGRIRHHKICRKWGHDWGYYKGYRVCNRLHCEAAESYTPNPYAQKARRLEI